MFGIDGRTIALIAGASAVAVASLYVFWGPSQSKNKVKNKKGLVPGLTNLGNSCFLNALLQSLASCTSVKEWLSSMCRGQEKCSEFISVMSRILKVLNNQGVEHYDEYCPSDVIEALHNRNWRISEGEQDCHEMFHVLTETMDEDSSKYPNILSIFDVKTLQSMSYLHQAQACQRLGLLSPQLPGKKQSYPFRGLLSSQLLCKVCGHQNPIHYDLFDSLSLTFPAKMGTTSIEALLRHYVQSEILQDVDCVNCTKTLQPNGVKPGANKKTMVKTAQIKKLTLGKLPRCLCLHIQRTRWLDNGMPMKRFDHVVFPEVLDMDPYVYHPRKRPQTLPGVNNLSFNTDLTGGNNGMATKPSPLESPVVSAPYSHPIRLLKAANHLQQGSASGIGGSEVNSNYLQKNVPNIKSPDQVQGRVPELKSPIQDTRVQQLADLYRMEVKESLPNRYQLVAAIVHMGDVYNGHFITYRRAPSPAADSTTWSNQWLHCSDLYVRKATREEVFSSTAYMLFYEKK